MIIKEPNGRLINTPTIYIHDDILLCLKFDRIKKIMRLDVKKHSSEVDRIYSIEFINVVAFSMTACDFWGKSECIFDFEYIEPSRRILVPQLETQWQKNSNPYDVARYNDYLETLVTFSSGDELRIVCETIEIPV